MPTLPIKSCVFKFASALRRQCYCSTPDAAKRNTVLPALSWEHPKAVHIELVSDSTVPNDSGWGLGFLSRFKLGVEGVNLATSGRSTGSFTTEGRWRQALALKPDYMLYSFAHNDADKKRTNVYVDPLPSRRISKPRSTLHRLPKSKSSS
ncbi:hypothetical protein SAMN05421770_101894 [Granulicella rosea]|uniref:Uncharacterized protein n=1 Tax=Granulicella rosea TaxID=474952 RepID=A0A239EBK3_9BACT|nr:hypothetical protein [Granulicella rosea]SNS42016.1 hypothetical protein SAMN05421770_101894 [Granulicella rosea]